MLLFKCRRLMATRRSLRLLALVRLPLPLLRLQWPLARSLGNSLPLLRLLRLLRSLPLLRLLRLLRSLHGQTAQQQLRPPLRKLPLLRPLVIGHRSKLLSRKKRKQHPLRGLRRPLKLSSN